MMNAFPKFTLLTTLVPIVCSLHVQAASPDIQRPNSAVRVGTFDSRAVAIAYYRSAEFQKAIGEKRATQSKAKAAGDAATVQKLETEGRQLQDQINRQGFGNAPIDDVIGLVQEQLPKVAEKSGVDVIVSQWAVVFQKSDSNYVDVTDQLVQLFKADEQTRKIITDIRKTKPTPIKELHTDK